MHLETVTVEQWARIAPLLPLERTGERGRPLADNRQFHFNAPNTAGWMATS